jgi:hypothetical protein
MLDKIRASLGLNPYANVMGAPMSRANEDGVYVGFNPNQFGKK